MGRKTILKPRVAAAANTYTSDFPDVKFRVPALIRTIVEKPMRFRHHSGSGSKINQFVRVPTSVDMQHFIQIHARVFE